MATKRTTKRTSGRERARATVARKRPRGMTRVLMATRTLVEGGVRLQGAERLRLSERPAPSPLPPFVVESSQSGGGRVLRRWARVRPTWRRGSGGVRKTMESTKETPSPSGASGVRRASGPRERVVSIALALLAACGGTTGMGSLLGGGGAEGGDAIGGGEAGDDGARLDDDGGSTDATVLDRTVPSRPPPQDTGA